MAQGEGEGAGAALREPGHAPAGGIGRRSVGADHVLADVDGKIGVGPVQGPVHAFGVGEHRPVLVG